MTIYVDTAVPYALAVATDVTELQALEHQIGGWVFQPPDPSVPIRAVNAGSRERLLKAGAVRVDGFACGFMYRQWEMTGRLGTPEEAEAFYRGSKTQRILLNQGEEPLW